MSPSGTGSLEHIDGAVAITGIICGGKVIAINSSSSVAVFRRSANRHSIAGKGYGFTKTIVIGIIGRLQVGLVSPGGTGSQEHIDGADIDAGIIGGGKITAMNYGSGVAVFTPSTHRQGVAGKGYGFAKIIMFGSIGGLQVSLVSPSGTGSQEHIDGAVFIAGIIGGS